MSDADLQSLIQQKLGVSHQWYGSGKLAAKRIEADQYYRGEPRGDEQDGRSQVVSRDVAESVDSLMPSLMRIFASGDQVVIFEPNGPEDEEAAKQATDYINHVFMQDNEGFLIMQTWFKDALLKKNGIVKSWYDVRTKRTKTNYEGLTEQQYQLFCGPQTDCTIISQQSYPDPSQPPQPVIDPASGQPQLDPQGQPAMTPPVMLYDLSVMEAKPEKRIRVINVPPDEFLIERRAAGIDTAGFLAHRCRRTISDLLESGFDEAKVKAIPTTNGDEFSQERIERFSDEETTPADGDGDMLDPTTRKVWVTDAYLLVDFDGDGYAEWRNVTLAGEETGVILQNIEVDDHAFSSLTPKIEPHKFYGRSLFDDTKDIQDIKTALQRGLLDNVYFSNAPRIGALESNVNLDDLLDVRPGGIVRMKRPDAIVPIITPNMAGECINAIEYVDSIREQRTGITRYNQGLDSDSLNKTATGINIIANAGQQRQEMIARNFAETGVKHLFRRLFQLSCQHEDKARTVRLRNKWVEVDPRDWKDRMDVAVSVGVGLGNKEQQAAIAGQVLAMTQNIIKLQGGINGPIVTAENAYAQLGKFIEAVGWKTPEPYFSDPKNAPPPQPPQPDIDQQLKKYELDNKANKDKADHEIQMLQLQDNHASRQEGRDDSGALVREQVMKENDMKLDEMQKGFMILAQAISQMAQSQQAMAQAMTAPRRGKKLPDGSMVSEVVMPPPMGNA